MSQLEDLSDSQLDEYRTQLKAELSQLEARHVVILGDLGLDEYLMGDVRRISPEAPVPVIEVATEDKRAGLAANVAQNISALKAKPSLLGVVGDDASAKTLEKILNDQGVKELKWVKDGDRPTTRKVRVMSGQHHMVRVDFEKKSFLSQAAENELIKILETSLTTANVLVLQDYGKGVLSEVLCQGAIALAKQNDVPVLVDPHRTTPISYYRGADLIKPNKDESLILSGLNLDELRMGPDTMIEVGQSLIEKAQSKSLAITMGSEGVLIFGEDGKITRVPTESRQVFDVTGAGDTFIAAFSLAIASKMPLVKAAILANAASGVVVGKVGCHPCFPNELESAL